MRRHEGVGPYIGITGFTSYEQVCKVVSKMPPSNKVARDRGHPGRCLMVGVLASEKSLDGIQVRKWKRHPNPEMIKTIWCDGCFNTLHYHGNSNNLVEVAKIAGLKPGFGMQLNMVWPNPRQVQLLYQRGIHVILQLNRTAVDLCVNFDDLVEKIRSYHNWISYLLVDLSGGNGVVISDQSLSCVLDLFHTTAGVGIAVAGGLGPGRIDLLDPLLFDHPHACAMRYSLSIDAESGVRDDDDELVVDRCQSYLTEALSKFEQ